MSAPDEEPSRRHLPLKVVAGSLALVTWMIVALGVGELYSAWAMLLMLVPLVAYSWISVSRLPADQQQRFAAAMERHDRSLLGRFGKIANALMLLIFLVATAKWLLGRFG